MTRDAALCFCKLYCHCAEIDTSATVVNKAIMIRVNDRSVKDGRIHCVEGERSSSYHDVIPATVSNISNSNLVWLHHSPKLPYATSIRTILPPHSNP